jgi:hypothetical protein
MQCGKFHWLNQSGALRCLALSLNDEAQYFQLLYIYLIIQLLIIFFYLVFQLSKKVIMISASKAL